MRLIESLDAIMPFILPNTEEQLALDNLKFILDHADLSTDYFEFSLKGTLSANLFFKTKTQDELKKYLRSLMSKIRDDLLAEPMQRRCSPLLIIMFQKLMHLNPHQICERLELITVPPLLKRNELTFQKKCLSSKDNPLHDRLDLVSIKYDPKTGKYTSPDDEKAHQHGAEAFRSILLTHLERLKSLIHRIFRTVGIYVFEHATYEEHDYLHTDIYANDFAIDPYQQKEASHFFVGHATNLISIPTTKSALNVLTDPVEGDLNSLLYPRMTQVANTIDGHDERMLPKVDVVVISHNHRDHLDTATLKKLVSQQPLMVIPEGDIALFRRLGFKNIVELKWWEQVSIRAEHEEILALTAVPTRHWSGRSFFDSHCSSFNGYVFQAPTLSGDIYFAGDTALMDDKISAPIFDVFNIQTSIQPGGPDECREEMYSTHQSSADALLMHFKNLLARYKKQTTTEYKPELSKFLEEIKTVKTIYNHFATFKLGTIRLKDTFYSVNRVIAAFKEDDKWRKNNLTGYEYEVYMGIQQLKEQMEFADGEQLSNNHIVEIINSSIMIPKVGQRIMLNSESKQEVNYRNLILNKRALAELDDVLKNTLLYRSDTDLIDINTFLIKALNAYNQPWHAFFSRTFKVLTPYVNQLKSRDVSIDDLIQRMEIGMQPLNRYGHMYSIINYVKWLLELNQKERPQHYVHDFFVCQQVNRSIDNEIHSKGSFSLISVDRKFKQKAFKELANQLAQVGIEKTGYEKTIKHWQSTLNNEQGTNLLNQHRLFESSGKTHSQKIVEESLNRLGC